MRHDLSAPLVIADIAHHDAIEARRVEIVERKGIGHPDTIADAIAERFSDLYSTFSYAELGEVAHHWVDKTMVIGGEAELRFGASRMVRPIRVHVVGKATKSVGGVEFPLDELAWQAATDVFSRATPLLDPGGEVSVHVDLSDAIGAGRGSSWYRPSSTGQLTDGARPRSNDSVMCTAYAPLSRLESLVLLVELTLNSGELKSHWPAIGSDIKVLGRRLDSDVEIICCVPCLARLVSTRGEYDGYIAAVTELIDGICRIAAKEYSFRISLNTRDAENVYLTHSGSALDTGDVGVVGRGNKLNGVIPLCREAGIEAPCGKNPTYHGGRIYSVVAQHIADCVWQRLGIENYVNIVAANGDQISEPTFVAVKAADPGDADTRSAIQHIVAEVLGELDRPSREIPAALRALLVPPFERMPARAWISADPLAGVVPVQA